MEELVNAQVKPGKASMVSSEVDIRRMKPDTSTTFTHHHFMVGYAKLAEVIATAFFTVLVFGFYMANYAWSTGLFTAGFTPVLATLFFASVLYVLVNTSAKAITPRRDILALVELVGAALFVTVAAWIFVAFPLNFAHVADVIPTSFQFLLSWLTNDIGRILVALVLLAGVIALAVDSAKLVWRVAVQHFHYTPEVTVGS
jgi:hypothetical protein